MAEIIDLAEERLKRIGGLAACCLCHSAWPRRMLHITADDAEIFPVCPPCRNKLLSRPKSVCPGSSGEVYYLYESENRTVPVCKTCFYGEIPSTHRNSPTE